MNHPGALFLWSDVHSPGDGCFPFLAISVCCNPFPLVYWYSNNLSFNYNNTSHLLPSHYFSSFHWQLLSWWCWIALRIPLGRNSPMHRHRLRAGCKAASWKRRLVSWWTPNWTQASNVSLWQKKPTASGHQVKRWHPYPLLSANKIHLECWVQCWTTRYNRDKATLQWVQKRTTKKIKGFVHLTYGKRLRAETDDLGLLKVGPYWRE